MPSLLLRHNVSVPDLQTYYTELWSGGQASFSSSQTRGWLTDLELVGETEIGWGSIMVHKAVVLTLCPSLAYVLHEVEDSKVIFTDVPLEVIKSVVKLIYTGECSLSAMANVKAILDLTRSLGLHIQPDQLQVNQARQENIVSVIKSKQRKKKAVEEVKIENESTQGFNFDADQGEGKECRELIIKMETVPDQLRKDVQAKTMDTMEHPNQERLECEVCLKTFTAKSSLRKHTRVFHAIEGEKENGEKFGCDACNKTFTTKIYRRRHVREVHDVTFKKQKKSKPSCKKWHGFNPKDNQHYDCDQCDKKFYGPDLFRDHNKKKLGVSSRPAKIVKAYDPEDSNHCHKCKKACSSKTHLIHHQDTRHLEGNPDIIKCRFCEREISRKQRGFLLEHLRKHTGESPEICSYCGKSFRQKKALKNHERLHTGVKPYKCEHCFAAFTQLNGLISHQKSRNGCQLQFD